MKHNNEEIRALDFFLLRSPMLPVNGDFNTKDHTLDHVLDNRVISEAIFLSSPTLFNELNKNRKEYSNDKKLTVSKYLTRMSNRATPFGLMSTISFGTFSDRTKITFRSNSYDKRITSLDNEIIFLLANKFQNAAKSKESLKFTTDNTIYYQNGYIKYIERKRITSDDFSISKISRDDILTLVLDYCSEEKSYADITSHLTQQTNYNETEIHHFLDLLIASNILRCKIIPPETILNPIGYIGKHIQYNFEISKLLSRLSDLLNAADLPNTKDTFPIYEEVGKIIQDLKLAPNVSAKSFYVNAFRNEGDYKLSRKANSYALEAANFLNSVTPMTKVVAFEEFKRKFHKRFGDEEVLLMEALDPETGIGYPPIDNGGSEIDKFSILRNFDGELLSSKISPSSTTENDNWNTFILDKYVQCLKNKEHEIHLFASDLNLLPTEKHRTENTYPESFYISCNLISPTCEDLDNGNFDVHFRNLSGPSFANLMSRFCYDQKIINTIRDSVKSLNNDNYIYCELCNVSSQHIGNIKRRPRIYEYEILLNSTSELDSNKTIKLNDLYISYIDDQLVLRSKSLNKYVLPRLTSAYNYNLSPIPHLRFLCDFQLQKTRGILKWEWGSVLDKMKYLPRVRFENNIIFSRARWRLTSKEISNNKKVTPESLKRYLTDSTLPDSIVISEGDKELLLNTKNLIHLEIICKLFNKREELIVQESLFDSSNCFVKDKKGGSYTNEFIFPYLNSKKSLRFPEKEPDTSMDEGAKYSRSYWKTFKIYCNYNLVDSLLIRINDIINEYIDRKVITRWFYIRYYDDNFHIRLRIETTKERKSSVEVINTLWSFISRQRYVSDVIICGYQRELNRYGRLNINRAETLFQKDSELALRLIKAGNKAGDLDFRWKTAMLYIDNLLTNLKLSQYEKFYLMQNISKSFNEEFRDHEFLLKYLKTSYREKKSLIIKLLNSTNATHIPAFKYFIYYNDVTSSTVTSSIRYFKTIEKHRAYEIIGSYIHMFMNRLFNVNHRKQELVIYDHLYMAYKSLLAISTKNKKQ